MESRRLFRRQAYSPNIADSEALNGVPQAVSTVDFVFEASATRFLDE
jgi:hypothetical protein